jgi:hypothetical protein
MANEMMGFETGPIMILQSRKLFLVVGWMHSMNRCSHCDKYSDDTTTNEVRPTSNVDTDVGPSGQALRGEFCFSIATNIQQIKGARTSRKCLGDVVE